MKQRTAKKIAKRVATERCKSIRQRYRWRGRRRQGYRCRTIVAALRVLPDQLLRRLIENPEKTRFWGRNYTITPRYVSGKIGDGGRLCFYTQLNTRPNYYVLRIDSRVGVRDLNEFDEICDAIDDEYGSVNFHCDTCDRDWSEGDCDDCDGDRNWPRLDDDCGSSWGCWPFELRSDE